MSSSWDENGLSLDPHRPTGMETHARARGRGGRSQVALGGGRAFSKNEAAASEPGATSPIPAQQAPWEGVPGATLAIRVVGLRDLARWSRAGLSRRSGTGRPRSQWCMAAGGSPRVTAHRAGMRRTTTVRTSRRRQHARRQQEATCLGHVRVLRRTDRGPTVFSVAATPRGRSGGRPSTHRVSEGTSAPEARHHPVAPRVCSPSASSSTWRRPRWPPSRASSQRAGMTSAPRCAPDTAPAMAAIVSVSPPQATAKVRASSNVP